MKNLERFVLACILFFAAKHFAGQFFYSFPPAIFGKYISAGKNVAQLKITSWKFFTSNMDCNDEAILVVHYKTHTDSLPMVRLLNEKRYSKILFNRDEDVIDFVAMKAVYTVKNNYLINEKKQLTKNDSITNIKSIGLLKALAIEHLHRINKNDTITGYQLLYYVTNIGENKFRLTAQTPIFKNF